MTSKITLPPWPGTSPAPKVVKAAEPTKTDVMITNEVREQMEDALLCLHIDYGVGLNRLMRAVGSATDLRSLFGKRKQVKAEVVADIARVTGMSEPELLTIRKLSLPRQSQVKAHLKSNDLIEPLRGFMVNRRRYPGD